MRGHFDDLCSDLLGRFEGRRAANAEGAAAITALPKGGALGIGVQNFDLANVNAKHFAHNLGKSRLVRLPVRLGADDDADLAGGVHLDVRAFPGAAQHAFLGHA